MHIVYSIFKQKNFDGKWYHQGTFKTKDEVEDYIQCFGGYFLVQEYGFSTKKAADEFIRDVNNSVLN